MPRLKCEIFANNSCRFCIFCFINVKQKFADFQSEIIFVFERISQLLKLSDLAVLSLPLLSPAEQRQLCSLPPRSDNFSFYLKNEFDKISSPVESEGEILPAAFFQSQGKVSEYFEVWEWSGASC